MATVVRVNSPFQFFLDSQGMPLDAGYVYIGEVGKDPRSYPVTAYWEKAGTTPAAQPLRTVNGYLSRSGTPTNIYVAGSHSMMVLDKNKTQVFFISDSSLAEESGTTTVTPADGSFNWEPAAVAALTTASAALRRTGSDNPDPTQPPKPTGLTQVPGKLTSSISWTPAVYTAGHGPGRVIVYASEWVGDVAPLVTTAKALGGIPEPVSQESLAIDPQKKVRVWIAFESADGFEGPKSDPVDCTSTLLGRADISDLLITQADISSALDLGRLSNDPSFAGGADIWAGFVQRAARTDAAAPSNCPAEFAASFKGRDCVSSRKITVEAGDSYLLSVWMNPLSTGLTGGIVIYETYADGRPMTAQAFEASPTPSANTWTKIKFKAKASSGVVAWQIGPHIGQAHTGQAVCWFANLRIGEMVDTDLVVQGAIAADAIAARSISTEQLIVGAVSDRVSAASPSAQFKVATGATSASLTTAGKSYAAAEFTQPIQRGILIIQALYDCNYQAANNASALALHSFEISPVWGVVNKATGVAAFANSENDHPIPWRLETPTWARARFSRTYISYVDEATAINAIAVVQMTFSAFKTDRSALSPLSSENLFCDVIVNATFVANKV